MVMLITMIIPSTQVKAAEGVPRIIVTYDIKFEGVDLSKGLKDRKEKTKIQKINKKTYADKTFLPLKDVYTNYDVTFDKIDSESEGPLGHEKVIKGTENPLFVNPAHNKLHFMYYFLREKNFA